MSLNRKHPHDVAFRTETVAILPGMGHQTSTAETASHPIATQHKLPQTASPRAKSLLALNVPTPARRPESTVTAPLLVSWSVLVILPKKYAAASVVSRPFANIRSLTPGPFNGLAIKKFNNR
jgi:hypothetical protein